MRRKEFLRAGAGLLAMTMVDMPAFAKAKPKLSFSTLGCPDWTFDAILDFASKNQYNGIELRGIMHEMDLTKCPGFSTPDKRRETMQKLKDKNIVITDLGSSATLHYDDPATRTKNIDEGKRFIDLAQQIGCPYVRVFPNKFLEGKEHAYTIELIIKALLELAEYAKARNVTVLMETHGDLVQVADIMQIMKGAAHSHTGLVWDIVNMWSITKVSPATVYAVLKPYIKHTHIKDAMVAEGKIDYKLLGQGNTPVFEGIDALYKDDFKGFYSFEWEKLWHPEIAEPDIAIAAYSKTMLGHFSK